MLPTLDIRLDLPPLVPPNIPLEFCQGVVRVQQHGKYLCWAACIEAVNRSNGRPDDQAVVAANHLHCPLASCQTNPVAGCCNDSVTQAQLELLWKNNGYGNARFDPHPINASALREHLKSTGPVQIALDNRHLVLLDRWRFGADGAVTVRLMDPQSRSYREIHEVALRSGSELGEWTGTIIGLPSGTPFNCEGPGTLVHDGEEGGY